jgi:hypothetical protein
MEFCKEILKLSNYRWIISFGHQFTSIALAYVLFLIYGARKCAAVPVRLKGAVFD